MDAETGMLRDLTQEDLVRLGLNRKGKWQYTVEDIEALPDGVRAELIDGELFRMEAPTWTHQSILVSLLFEIESYIRKRKGKCEVMSAPFAVYIKKDKRNYVEPDISVICDETKKSEKGCQGAPDWAIEIASPSSRKMDYEQKVELYREAGVREYWIVDAEKETVSVYDFEHDGATPTRYAFSDWIKAGIFEELYLKLSEMDFT